MNSSTTSGFDLECLSTIARCARELADHERLLDENERALGRLESESGTEFAAALALPSADESATARLPSAQRLARSTAAAGFVANVKGRRKGFEAGIAAARTDLAKARAALAAQADYLNATLGPVQRKLDLCRLLVAMPHTPPNQRAQFNALHDRVRQARGFEGHALLAENLAPLMSILESMSEGPARVDCAAVKTGESDAAIYERFAAAGSGERTRMFCDHRTRPALLRESARRGA